MWLWLLNMIAMQNNRFDTGAANWDQVPRRVMLANAVVAQIIQAVNPQPYMRLLDYGAGTGLVTLGLHHLVREAIAVDSSRGMLEQLAKKAAENGANNLQTHWIDFNSDWHLPDGIDLLVSSMTMHHIQQPMALMNRFKAVMNSGGMLCVADLEKEDGSFHDHADETIKHHGFTVEEMELYFSEAGFTGIRTVQVIRVEKERQGQTVEYPVNLTSGRVL